MDANGSPIAGLYIAWTPAGRRASGADEPPELHSVATTDAQGVYEANLLPPGPCRMVSAHHSYYFTWEAELAGLPRTRVVRLRQDATVDAPDIRLPVDPSLLGTLDVLVVDPAGRPVRKASVHCTSQVQPWGNRGASDTDARGRIRLTGVNPGEASVHVSPASKLASGHLSVWLPPGAHRRVRVVLPRVPRVRSARRRIRVVCRDDTGRALRGCRVSMYGLDAGRRSVEKVSGRGGVAVLEGHPHSDYRDSVSGSAWKPGYHFTSIEANLKSPKRTIRVDAVLRREVNLGFEVVDEATGAQVQRTHIDIRTDERGRMGLGPRQGVIGPDPPELPRPLWVPSTGIPVGRASLRFASPGYEPKSLSLRVRPRKGYRRVVVKLTPAR